MDLFDFDEFEAKIFIIFTNYVLGSSHLPHFYLNADDEIQWRSDYFGELLKKHAKDLSEHFAIINLDQRFFLNGWLMSMFANVLPSEFT